MEPEILKFEDIVRGCIKRWRIIVIITILTTLIGGVFAVFTKPNIRYQGIFKVFIKETSIDNEIVSINQENTSLIPNYIELIRTRDFMENVVKRTTLDLDAKVVLKTLNLVNLDKSDFIQIKYTSNSKEETQQVLEGIGDELLDVVSKENGIKANKVESIDITELNESKSKKLIVLGSLFGGLILSILAAFIMECINKTFKTKGELERELKINVIGNIPKVDKDNAVLINSDNVDTSYLEAVKSLALDIKYGEKNRGLKSIALVSSLDNEGNSTLATNLALILSEGNKIILLDANINENSIGKLLNVNSSKGLIDILENKEIDAIYHYNNNLDIITSGENSNRILSIDKEEFSNLIENLKVKYDYLIINTPSIIGNSDAKVILSKVEGVLFNLKAEETNKSIVKEALKSINYLGINLIGLVFNFGDKFRNKYY